MNSFANTLANTLFQKNIELLSLENLKALSLEHPYSSAIQLLYTQKLQQTENAEYEIQLQKTLLHYNNPLFIKHVLEADNSSEVSHISSHKKVAEKKEFTAEEGLNKADEAEEKPFQFTFEPLDPTKAELSFTPYHTIDYFAAQGIKLGEPNGTNDRFGNQLKSFTAWLKQMKRLTGATNQTSISTNDEKQIEKMAEQSLQGENADTEAMAQVWAQQGNFKKAIEVYKKLSLQIPAKSAYFAAKIDHLKK